MVLFLVYVTTHELNMLIGDGELYRLFFRWRSSEAKLAADLKSDKRLGARHYSAALPTAWTRFGAVSWATFLTCAIAATAPVVLVTRSSVASSSSLTGVSA